MLASVLLRKCVEVGEVNDKQESRYLVEVLAPESNQTSHWKCTACGWKGQFPDKPAATHAFGNHVCREFLQTADMGDEHRVPIPVLTRR